ncbi:hypothetical protein [Amycolatopsis sp. NPDC051071]|uniref:hypothetical protein n=1 Tax=Amycolatopsis sp. NPDC051071 TaxID=3154637 RepID=UPI003434AC9E
MRGRIGVVKVVLLVLGFYALAALWLGLLLGETLCAERGCALSRRRPGAVGHAHRPRGDARNPAAGS